MLLSVPFRGAAVEMATSTRAITRIERDSPRGRLIFLDGMRDLIK